MHEADGTAQRLGDAQAPGASPLKGEDRALDTAAVDTGAVDTGAPDTGSVDTGSLDVGAVDAGTPADAGLVPDAGNPTGLTVPCQKGPGWTLFRFHYSNNSKSPSIDVWDASCSYSEASARGTGGKGRRFGRLSHDSSPCCRPFGGANG